jgi:hypothetical protein
MQNPPANAAFLKAGSHIGELTDCATGKLGYKTALRCTRTWRDAHLTGRIPVHHGQIQIYAKTHCLN